VTPKDQFHPEVSILTGGGDRHYSLGLASALIAAGVTFDFIGSDEHECPDLWRSPCARFLNLRGEQSLDASLSRKVRRVLAYYLRLLGYAAKSRAEIFHILWNNKFELFDRTLLMLVYRLLGKKIAFTAHNVNAGARDNCDSLLNRASLKFQYRLCDVLFVHTRKMKEELVAGFKVPAEKVVIIPYGLNNVLPDTALAPDEARRRLGLRPDEKVLLFFGNIAPYKGLEYLVQAFALLAGQDPLLRVVIAGRPKGPAIHWKKIQAECNRWRERIIQKIDYISDADTEIYFKAADVLVLPYTHIFQSGVLSIAYRFGLPVIAADVGSFREEIISGQTGFVVQPRRPAELAGTIQNYFRSRLYRELDSRRREIQILSREKYSWTKVAALTVSSYARIVRRTNPFPAAEATVENPPAGFVGEKL
jgi:glycosyltransferase involved in cell wall biosynthesis